MGEPPGGYSRSSDRSRDPSRNQWSTRPGIAEAADWYALIGLASLLACALSLRRRESNQARQTGPLCFRRVSVRQPSSLAVAAVVAVGCRGHGGRISSARIGWGFVCTWHAGGILPRGQAALCCAQLPS